MRLSGRLGNQMFQYAAGLGLARQIGATLTLEGLPPDSARKSRVQVVRCFELTENCTYSATSWAERLSRFQVKFFGRLWLPLRRRGLRVVYDRQTSFDPTLARHKRGCFLCGQWQSPRYFRDVEPELRRVFDATRFADRPCSESAARIQGEPGAVAVHVRRGDYADNPRTRRRFGLCEREYYDRARKLIEDRGAEPASPHFFIFSDDPEAARAELSGWTATTFISGHTQEQDLFLMSLCRQAIIANSTFGWWGAWLIPPSPAKRVIAPAQWFSPRMQMRKPTTDLCPRDWIRA